MSIETFDIEDTLDDSEIYGIFTNQEGSNGNGRTSGGVYTTNHSTTAGSHAYLITTSSIGNIFSYQVEFIIPSGYGYNHCGIYLGAAAPTGTFDPQAVATSLIDVWVRYTFRRLYITRTNSAGALEYWNFTTHAWQAEDAYYNSIAANKIYRITITRDGDNTIVEIYNVTDSTLIDTITAINSETKSINNNAYFYFGHPQRETTSYSATVNWDNAGFEEEMPPEVTNTMMLQQIDG